MDDLSHYYAILRRLGNQRARYVKAPSELAAAFIAQTERELTDEKRFLSQHGVIFPDSDISDDELLLQLKQP